MKKLAYILTALAATTLGNAAQAASIISAHTNPTILGSSGSFGDTISGTTGTFTDTFSFLMPWGFTLQSASLTFANVVGGAKLKFTGPGLGITLNGVSFMADSTGAFHLNDQPLLSSNVIVVNGYYKAVSKFPRYSNNFVGSLSFSGGGVPEPATWALMLLGIGGIGAGMRRRNVSALRFA